MLSPTSPPAPTAQRHSIMQGECRVSHDPNLVLTTILGSCIACCLYDPRAKLGGMNHFLLPLPPQAQPADIGAAQRYGLYAMEVLVNEMLKAGARRSFMRARLFGGANMHVGMRSIGIENANFACDFLAADGIELAASDIGGTSARRVDFQPSTGRIRCRLVQGAVPDAPLNPPKPPVGEIELF